MDKVKAKLSRKPKKRPLPVGVEIVAVRTSVGVTLNMGKYESLRLEASMTAEVQGGADAARAAHTHLTELCVAQLQRDFDGHDWPLVTTS